MNSISRSKDLQSVYVSTHCEVKRVLFDGVYATFDAAGVPGWHYFLCDHTGSVRVVADAWGHAEQISHYYPYGLTFADVGKASDHQPYKFGGKELDAMYGINLHDFHARTQIPDLGRFDRPDPLCEKTPHLSTYLFCANDPVNNTDPTGMVVLFNDFMYTPGCEYNGNDDFIHRCVQAMNIIYESGGDKLIDDLVTSESQYSYLPEEDGKSYTTGNNHGDAKAYINTALDKNCFISTIAHESMHAAQFLNGQGGQSIFNEIEAYAFEATISINACDISDNHIFLSAATAAQENFFGELYHDAISSLSTEYSNYKSIIGIMTFKKGAMANNSGIYNSYPNYSNKVPQTSLLKKYSPWINLK